jgi:hypothetical protein
MSSMCGTGKELYIYSTFCPGPSSDFWLETCDGTFDFTLSEMSDIGGNVYDARSGGRAGSHGYVS